MKTKQELQEALSVIGENSNCFTDFEEMSIVYRAAQRLLDAWDELEETKDRKVAADCCLIEEKTIQTLLGLENNHE